MKIMKQEEIKKLGNALKEFINLPNLEEDLESTSLEDDYNPTLYKYNGLWCVDWISSNGGCIKSFEHEDIIEVIKQASQWINENFCDSGD